MFKCLFVIVNRRQKYEELGNYAALICYLEEKNGLVSYFAYICIQI